MINDSKYGIGISENTLSLSLLRATERPDPESDIGKHSFAYLIYPHSGSAVFLNMLEDKLYLTDEIDYKPFEIITIGILR